MVDISSNYYSINYRVFPTQTPSENSSQFYSGIASLLGMSIGMSGGFAIGGWNQTSYWTTGSGYEYLFGFYPIICPSLNRMSVWVCNSLYTSFGYSNCLSFHDGNSVVTQTWSATGNQFTLSSYDVAANVGAPHGCFLMTHYQRFNSNSSLSRYGKIYTLRIGKVFYGSYTINQKLNVDGTRFSINSFPLSSSALFPAVRSSGPLGAAVINGINDTCERLLKTPMMVLNIAAPVASTSETPEFVGYGLTAKGMRFSPFVPSSLVSPPSTESLLPSFIPSYVPDITYSIQRWIPYRQGAPAECNTIHIVFLVDLLRFYTLKNPSDFDLLNITITVVVSGVEITISPVILFGIADPAMSWSSVMHAAVQPTMPEDQKITIGNRDFWPFKIKSIELPYIDQKGDSLIYKELVQSIAVWIGGEIA